MAERWLKKEASRRHRDRKMVSFKEVKSVGILYFLEDETTYHTIKHIASSLQAQGKKVRVVGLCDGDRVPLFYLPTIRFDLLTSKELNWYGKPVGNFVPSFLDEPLDVLFFFTEKDFPPLEYLFTLSSARLKVSNGHDSIRECSDFMIEGNKKGWSSFVETAIHYLSIINKHDATT